ncbi:digestive organ expansion factor [Fimicolochytrium jonesii]|uniref:digestive organ expansion factor n=1 Tax=Fimicolochytrium jonesii TaxID=1396493 RepID=UPI0022FE410F|nr:digestive organ expansion factor [Fimicolochytrium jonesii]KAI8822997.1 digestive organ expansion factor [Fimicolochytrium jonesii]
MTPLQASLFPHVNEYQDVMFAKQTHANSAQLRQMYALHAMNHVFKTRDRVLKNTTKLKSEAADDLDLRDQGFTRPKVLIIVPFKHTALEIVKMLIALSGTKQQDNKKRFFEEFGLPPEDDTVDPKKSEDFKKTFAGNIDDCFRMGIKFSRKQLKLFADFYSSDIIIASPLGLRMVIGAEGEKKRDFDYLSAIEVVIMDSADVFLMQNWDHVQHIFEHLNLIPKDPHGCDFSRVRAYYLDGRAKYVRQTLIFSRLLTPEMNALLTTHCKNVAGKLKIKPRYTQGSIADVVITVPQIFHRVPCASPIDADDARFTYFVEKILPTLRQSVVQQKHSMIFVPSYFDFVRVKKYLEEHNYNSVQLCEYTPRREISGARGEFFRGEASYMLYTERFHFFRRYRIKGIRHLVFYALPDYSDTFYPEMVNMLESDASKDVTCTVLYTKYDRLKLERVVGSRRVGHMIEGAKDAFMFVEEK